MPNFRRANQRLRAKVYSLRGNVQRDETYFSRKETAALAVKGATSVPVKVGSVIVAGLSASSLLVTGPITLIGGIPSLCIIGVGYGIKKTGDKTRGVNDWRRPWHRPGKTRRAIGNTLRAGGFTVMGFGIVTGVTSLAPFGITAGGCYVSWKGWKYGKDLGHSGGAAWELLRRRRDQIGRTPEIHAHPIANLQDIQYAPHNLDAPAQQFANVQRAVHEQRIQEQERLQRRLRRNTGNIQADNARLIAFIQEYLPENIRAKLTCSITDNITLDPMSLTEIDDTTGEITTYIYDKTAVDEQICQGDLTINPEEHYTSMGLIESPLQRYIDIIRSSQAYQLYTTGNAALPIIADNDPLRDVFQAYCNEKNIVFEDNEPGNLNGKIELASEMLAERLSDDFQTRCDALLVEYITNYLPDIAEKLTCSMSDEITLDPVHITERDGASGEEVTYTYDRNTINQRIKDQNQTIVDGYVEMGITESPLRPKLDMIRASYAFKLFLQYDEQNAHRFDAQTVKLMDENDPLNEPLINYMESDVPQISDFLTCPVLYGITADPIRIVTRSETEPQIYDREAIANERISPMSRHPISGAEELTIEEKIDLASQILEVRISDEFIEHMRAQNIIIDAAGNGISVTSEAAQIAM